METYQLELTVTVEGELSKEFLENQLVMLFNSIPRALENYSFTRITHILTNPGKNTFGERTVYLDIND